MPTLTSSISKRDYNLVMSAVWFQGCLTLFAMEAAVQGLSGWPQENASASLVTQFLIKTAPFVPNGLAAVASVVWTASLVLHHRPQAQRDEGPKRSLAFPLTLHFGLTSLLILMFIAIGLPILEMISSL